MDRKTSACIAAGTLATALGIGAVMQYWPTASDAVTTTQSPIVVTDVQEVSSTPKPPVSFDANAAAILPVSLVSAQETPKPTEAVELPQSPDLSGFDCDPKLTATPAAGALIRVILNAPCHGSERVTLHHNGLMFSEVTQPDGSLQIDVPALAENALIVASFLDGSGAVAHTVVTSVPFYERVVLQWRGNAGLQLHAREFDAAYFSEGHVWQGADTDASRATAGDGGFLTTLGNAETPDALLAEVYTFPSGMTDKAGTIALSVETEIQAANCGAVVEAQTLEIRNGRDLRSKELTIDVPSCDTVGDFLMLKNLVEDLTLASN